MSGSVFAVSDLHVGYADNRAIAARLRPEHPDDWLVVAGDVADRFDDIGRTLADLRSRFRTVIWTPGNHELWSPGRDPVQLRGVERYEALVQACRDLGVLTPEDEFAVWRGPGGPVTVAPLFCLYDYSFRVPGVDSKEESLRRAYASRVVCSDEFLLHPDPYPDRESWCAARLAYTRERLDALAPDARTLLVGHWPLVRQPTEILRYPDFAQWCGTTQTADWHLRYRAAAVVYGHLHIPRTTTYDGVRFEEVSLGYPREWSRRSAAPDPMRRILPVDSADR